jgi:hypothetical protein
VHTIGSLWLLGGSLAGALLLYGFYLHAFFQWHASLAGTRAVAKLAMHETARQITVTDAAG